MSEIATDLATEVLDDFGHAVIAGLSKSQKMVPARYFYDRRGSELFEEITRLPEYYPTRTETALLKTHAPSIARLAGMGRPLIEFGSGSSAKTPIVLAALNAPIYVPIDISSDFLASSADAIARTHPHIEVVPVARDFTQPLAMPVDRPVVGFFPGSTIGNFSPGAAVNLLRTFRETLGDKARFLIGVDTRKNPRLLEAAYNDSAGVTAAFNLNLLHRINRELDGDIPLEAFEHMACWHDGYGRIEMHLQAMRDIAFHVAGRSFAMKSGETIHTENSYKYRIEEARLLGRAAGWDPLAVWTDEDAMFSVHLWSASAETP